MMQSLDSLSVSSAQGAYAVEFDASLETLAAALARLPRSMVLVDRVVAHRYGEVLKPLLATRPVHEIDATEEEKTLEGCSRALSFLQANGASRQTQVVAVGGGVVQDIATFCTHVYFRGIKWVYAPTTLLGMADSCIGAKASINLNGYKNQLGVFHSPSSVRICLGFLDSLAEAEIRSGYGEIVKLHLTGARMQFRQLSQRIDADGLRNADLGNFVRTSLLIKKAVIEVDEFDGGLRQTLNYGHTFGHALESITCHGIPHGLAVAWGMDLVNYVALRKGMLAQADFDEIHAFLQRHFAWRLEQPIDAGMLISATRRDKKSRDGKLTLVLPIAPEALKMVAQDYTSELEAWIRHYLLNLSIVTHG